MGEKDEERYTLTDKGVEAALYIYEMFKDGLDVEEIATVLDMGVRDVQILFAMANYAGVFEEFNEDDTV